MMAVTYKKLFHLLIDKGMTNAELMEKAGFSANIITRINHVSSEISPSRYAILGLASRGGRWSAGRVPATM